MHHLLADLVCERLVLRESMNWEISETFHGGSAPDYMGMHGLMIPVRRLLSCDHDCRERVSYDRARTGTYDDARKFAPIVKNLKKMKAGQDETSKVIKSRGRLRPKL